LQELFESSNGDFDIQKTHINDLGDYVITAGLSNNGILGKTDIKAKIFNANTITIDMFGNAFYRQFRYKMVTHARVFSLKSILSITQKQGIFLSSAMHFLKYNFGYENMCSWAKIKQEKISLPVKKDREIDFAFMEDFISQLEAYLLVTGLKNYTLTPAEEQALTDFQNGNIKWGEFLIGDLFEKLNLRFLKQKFDKEKDISKEQTTEFDLPLINAKDGNNGIMYYGRSCDFESAEMAIDIVNDGAVSTGNVCPQPQKTGVLYNAYLVKPLFPVTERLLYFFSASIQKSIKPKFGYENKAGWTKVKEEKIFLPIQREEINFEYMETLISAVQKLVIKDVVEYADRKIEATREIIHKK
jgi:type IIS restriction enzyme protein